MKTIHELYRAACAADDAWQAGLVKVFGKKAGDMRYRPEGKQIPLDALHDEFARATKEWRNHPHCALSKDIE